MRRLSVLGLLLMAIEVSVRSFNTGTGITDITIAHGLSAAPKAGIVFTSGRTGSTDGNGASDHYRGTGFFANGSGGLQQHCVASASDDGVGTAAARSVWMTNAWIAQCNFAADTILGVGGIASIDGTNIVVSVGGNAFDNDIRFTAILLGGSDLRDAEVGDFIAAGAAPVDQDVAFTGAGGDDQRAMFFLGASNTVAPSDVDPDSNIFFGAAKTYDTVESFVHGGASNNGSGTAVTHSYLRSGEAIAEYGIGANSIVNLATYVTPLTIPSGFRINWSARTRDTNISYLVLFGDFQIKCGELLTLTNTTTDITGTPGFTAKGLLFCSHNKAENASAASTAQDKRSMGVATGTGSQHCQAMADRNGNTNMFVSTALEQDQIYVNLDEVNQVLQGSANLTAIDATTFTLRMTDADPAQASVQWLAFGDAPASGTQVARPDEDISDGSWTPSVALSPLFQMLDEVSADDADYITSGAAPVQDTAVIGLGSIAPPEAGTVTLRVRARLE